MRMLAAEFRKLKGSYMLLWSGAILFAAQLFCIMPVRLAAQGGTPFPWKQYMGLGSQLFASWYAALLFSLVTAYVFGREYDDGTVKELFTLPLRREWFVASKTAVLVLWLAALAVLSVAVQALAGLALGLHGFSWAVFGTCLADTLKISALVFGTMPIVALLAMAGRGYLVPMAYAAVMTTVGLGLAEAGWTRWFPWSMQIAVTGVSFFPPAPMPGLVAGSWALVAVVFVTGSAAVVWYADAADCV